MSQGLEGVRQAARERKQEKFTALLHHLTIDLLRDSFYSVETKRGSRSGSVTWQEYGQGVEDRLVDLHDRVHRGAYRAQPSRRVYILKGDGRQRPLGVAVLEDKIVQRAMTQILNQIYETDFQGVSYGFRPGRSQHQALDALTVGIERKKVNWILDLDIRGFFDNFDQKIGQVVEERIADPRILRLIRKWLKAGVMEDGNGRRRRWVRHRDRGFLRLLANVYLHYALDLWDWTWRRQARGDVIMVRYADDAVLGFENRDEAERFRRELQEQLRKGRTGTAPGEDPTDRVREIRRNQPENGEEKISQRRSIFWVSPTSAGRTGRRTLHGETEDDSRKRMRAKLQRNPAEVPATNARCGTERPESGCGRSCRATSTITRFPGKRNGSDIPRTGDSALAAHITPSKPKAPPQLGPHSDDLAAGGFQHPRAPSLSECSL